MHVWLLFLAGTTVYGVSRISETDFMAVELGKAVEGRKLNGSVISEEDVDSESSCQVNCVKEERCLSYNFQGRTNNKAGRFKCQLSNSDRFVGIANFSIDKDFKYVGTQTACEADQSPCGDKELCIPDYKGEIVKYKCVNAVCPAGWNLHMTSCYYINDTDFNWTNARAACRSLGADLAIIKSQEQNKFVTDLIYNQTTDTPWGGVWIGMRRNDDDKNLYWIDGTPWDNKKGYFSPKNPSSEGEGCVHMIFYRNMIDVDGKWNDINCQWNRDNNPPYILCMRSAIYSDLG